MWPTARISAMGGEAATVAQAGSGAEPREQSEHQARPVSCTARLWDDGVVDPRTTRDLRAQALGACAHTSLEKHRVLRT